MKLHAVTISILFSVSSMAQNLVDPYLNQADQKPAAFFKSKSLLPRTKDYYLWDTTGNDWKYQNSSVCMYNSDNAPMLVITEDTLLGTYFSKDTFEYSENELVSHVKYLYQYFSWKPSVKETWARDFYGHDTSYLSFSRVNGNWQVSSGTKHLYQYDTDKKITEDITVGWNGATWVNSVKQNYIFFEDFPAEYTIYLWDTVSGSWAPVKKELYTRYTGTSRLQSLTLQLPSGDNWVNVQQSNYSYNEADFTIITDTAENYLWKHKEKQTMTRYPDTVFTYLTEKYINNSWHNSTKVTNVSDAHLNTIESLHEIWVQGAWQTSLMHTYDYSYRADGAVSEIISSSWDSNLHALQNKERYVYSNFIMFPDEVTKNKPEKNNIRLFPNPAGKYITCSLEGGKQFIAEITDLSGKIIQGGTFQDSEPIDISRLEKGVYFIIASSGYNRYQSRFIKE